jgi:conjugative relaxase-like TrwC/TraI family protein
VGGPGVLSIGKLGASTGHLEYYERQVAAGAEDYYAGRGESPGVWLGVGATGIGLKAGERVERADFMALMRGAHPADGSVLRRMTASSKVAAVDLTFSAPKSVSVLFAVAGSDISDALLEAHERAVAAAVSYLEREACYTRRGHGGADRIPGEGFIAAAYRHRLSRSADPQLHDHVVVANLTRAGGKFTALDAQALFEHKSAAGAVYRAQLRAEVSERLAWVSWAAASRGLFEIDGVPAEVLRHFSQRRVEIEQRAAEITGSEAGRLSRERMQGVALATRRPKDGSLDGAGWREDARARAGEHGFGPRELRALTSRPAVQRVRATLQSVVARLSGPGGLTANHNTFARRHALAEIAGEFAGGIQIASLEQATDTYLADPSVHGLGGDPARFTTQDLLACERSILDGAAHRQGAQVAVVPAMLVSRELERSQPELNADQAEAVRAIASSGNGVDCVQALAGTGKTTMMRTLANVYGQAGFAVIGAAPTARAARELGEVAQIPSGTLHALVRTLERQPDFVGEGTVLLLDEAGMASTRITAQVFAHAEHVGAKVVAVGDSGQLTSVDAGGWLAALTRQNPGPELRQVIRQHDPAERRALEALHDGDAQSYLDHKGSEITIHAAEADAISAVIEDWAAQSAQTGRRNMMIARDNGTREQLNRAARAHLKADGLLPTAGITIGEREWVCGDRVIARRNDRRLDIDNGTFATITALHPDGQGVRLLTDRGQERTLDDRYLRDHLEHAYAITGHASQGATVDSAIVVGRPEEFTREWAYTALSRARDRTTIYLITDRGHNADERGDYAPAEPVREPGDALSSLGRALTQSEAEPLAVERTMSIEAATSLPPRVSKPERRTPTPTQRDLSRARSFAPMSPDRGMER